MYHAFYSDPHFGHSNILVHSNRAFVDVDEMNRTFVARYNAVVKPEHTVLWLGDSFFCKSPQAAKILKSMNGYKHLIIGNHDGTVTQMLEIGFDTVHLGDVFIRVAGRKIRCSHYPYWNEEPEGTRRDMRYEGKRPLKVKGEVLLHGHTHSSKQMFRSMIHVGVDAWDYQPARRSEVEALVRTLPRLKTQSSSPSSSIAVGG